jgi:hypothetical protein
MLVCKRILAGLTFLLATVGLLLSLAGGIGVWLVKEPVTERATWVFERIGAALDAADENLDHAQTSLARAAKSLKKARADQREIAQQPQRAGTLRQMVARTVQRSIAPELSNAHEKLHTVAEAAVVVNSVLEDVGSFPFLSVSGLEVESLNEMNSGLAKVSPMAWQLSRLLGEPAGGSEGDGTGARLSRIDQTLKTAQRLIAGYKTQVTQVRQRAEALKSQTLSWITPAAVLVSLICFWIALSQVSLLCHAWSWSRPSGPE